MSMSRGFESGECPTLPARREVREPPPGFLFDKLGKEVIVIVRGESFITLSKGESMKRIDLKLAIYN